MFFRVPQYYFSGQIALNSDEIFQARFKDWKHNVWKSNDTPKNTHNSEKKCSCILLLFIHLTLLNLVS